MSVGGLHVFSAEKNVAIVKTGARKCVHMHPTPDPLLECYIETVKFCFHVIFECCDSVYVQRYYRHVEQSSPKHH